MDILASSALGIIQGITEFLPISSSGHLIIFRDLFAFDISHSLAFDVALHWGTLVAVVTVFRKDVLRLLGGFVASIRERSLQDRDGKLSWYIAAATVPALLIGLLFRNWVEDTARTVEVVAFTLFIGGIAFFIIEAFHRSRRKMSELTFLAVLIIGVAQSIALIPGVSRSGITIITAIALGLKRYDAARFSFLLSIPITFLVGLYQLIDLIQSQMDGREIGLFIMGFFSSAITGYFVIRFLLGYLRRHRLTVFGVYRILLAILIPFLR